MHSPGFDKYYISKFFACGKRLSFVFTYLMSQFSKKNRLQRVFNQLVVIIVENNISIVKNSIALDDET